MELPALTHVDRSEEKLVVPKLYDQLDIPALRSSGQRIFGTPGAALSWGVDGTVNDVVTAGLEGEKMTAKALSSFSESHPQAVVFHSASWPGHGDADTDHLVMIGKTVILIDTKRWKAKRKYSVTAKGTILRGTVPFDEGKVKIVGAMKAWRSQLPPGVNVHGLVCISQDEVFVPYDQNWRAAPFKLVTVEKLEEYLDRFATKNKKAQLPLSSSAFRIIALSLIKERNRRAELIRMS